MPICEACGAEILYAQTENGSLLTLDPEPTRAGNVLLDTSPTAQPRLAEATWLSARQALEARDAGRTLYRLHQPNCLR